MFQDALMESTHSYKTRSRYYTIFGVMLNGCVLALLVLMPLLYPEALPRTSLSTMLIAPPPPVPLPPPVPVRAALAVRSLRTAELPSRIAGTVIQVPGQALPEVSVSGPFIGDGQGLSDILGVGTGAGPAPTVLPPPLSKKISVSQGVMAGNILQKQQPTYPQIAKVARIQGTVILSATISKAGTIENLTIVSGQPMLVQAALDAVKQWRYKPYLLSGAPVEVQTQINVTFTLGE